MEKPISLDEIKGLNNFEILGAVKVLRIPSFRGVFVRDSLPSKPNVNESGILNLDDSTGDGTHWTMWYRKNGKNYYFDSYGIQPPLELRNYLNGPIFYTTEKIQHGLKFCGHVCLYVLKQLSLGRHLQDIVNDLH